jgi:colicin import membrane protein
MRTSSACRAWPAPPARPIPPAPPLQSSGPSSSYGGRIRGKVKPNIVFTDDIPGNPAATVLVKLAPDGTIIGKRLTKTSGVKTWDDAVLRALDRTETFPRDVDGRVPPSVELVFRPRD